MDTTETDPIPDSQGQLGPLLTPTSEEIAI